MKLFWRTFILITPLIVSGCLKQSVLDVEDNSNIQTQGASSLLTIKGTATLGPINGGYVYAYSLDNEGQAITSTSLASARTDSEGKFNLYMKPQTSPFIITVTGGTYEDETTGEVKGTQKAISVLLSDTNQANDYATSRIGVSAITTLETKLTRNMLKVAGTTTETQRKQIIKDANELLTESFGIDPKIAASNIYASNFDASKEAGYSAALQAGVSLFTHRTGTTYSEWAEMMATDITDGVFDGKINGYDITFKDSSNNDIKFASSSNPLAELREAMDGLDAVKPEWDFSAITQSIIADPDDSGMHIIAAADANTTQLISDITAEESKLTIDPTLSYSSYENYIDFSNQMQNAFAAETSTQQLKTSVSPTKLLLTSPSDTLSVDSSQATIFVALMDDNGNIDTTSQSINVSLAVSGVGSLNKTTITLTQGVGSVNVTSTSAGVATVRITNQTYGTLNITNTKKITYTYGAPAKVVLGATNAIGTKTAGYMNIQVKDQFNNPVSVHERFDVDIFTTGNAVLSKQTVPVLAGRGEFQISNTIAETVSVSMQMNSIYSTSHSSINTSNTQSVIFVSPIISYSTLAFNESNNNDGTIAETANVEIVYGSFAGFSYEDFIASGKVSVSNLPTGLTAKLNKVNSTLLSLSFLGAANAHLQGDSISNLSLQFHDSAFTANLAADIANASVSNIAINFESSSQDISGTAALGPISGGTVSVYTLTGDGSQDQLIATATTDVNGDFTLTMSPQSVPFMISISGGSYIDEATGETVQVVDPIKLMMPDSTTYDQYYLSSGVAVTALTTMEAELATNLQTLSGNTTTTDLQQSIADANVLISEVFQLDPDSPVGDIYDNTLDLTTDEGKNALIQAGISVLTAQLDMSYADYIELMALDLSDGKLDGAVSGETITYEASQGTYLSLVDLTTTQTTGDLLEQAIQTFMQVSTNSAIMGETVTITFNDDVSYYSSSISLSTSLDQATTDLLNAYSSQNLAAVFDSAFAGSSYSDFVDFTSTQDIYSLLNLNASTSTTATKVTLMASLDGINPVVGAIPINTMFYLCVYAKDDSDVLDANFAATTGVTINSTSSNLVNVLSNTTIPFGGGGGCDIYTNSVAETLTISLTDVDTSLNTTATLDITFSP